MIDSELVDVMKPQLCKPSCICCLMKAQYMILREVVCNCVIIKLIKLTTLYRSYHLLYEVEEYSEIKFPYFIKNDLMNFDSNKTFQVLSHIINIFIHMCMYLYVCIYIFSITK